MRAAAIVHRAVAPLLPSEGAPYRAIAAGTGGAVEEQGGGKRRL